MFPAVSDNGSTSFLLGKADPIFLIFFLSFSLSLFKAKVSVEDQSRARERHGVALNNSSAPSVNDSSLI